MYRTDIVVLLLAVSCMDIRAEEPIQNMSVCLGKSVLLPCPCSEDTQKLVWQIGEDIVVNHCCEKKHPVNDPYQERTEVFLSSMKGNCSLLLRDVMEYDEKIFTCHFFDRGTILKTHAVRLKVLQEGVQSTTKYERQPYKGFSVGVPLSLILIILAGVIVALFLRKYRQKRPRMVLVQDPQAGVPIMNHTPV